MMSLFSSFDKWFYFFPILPYIIFSIFFVNYFFLFSTNVSMISIVISLINNYFSEISFTKSKIFELFLSSLVFMVLFENFISVGPFSFAFNSQVDVVALFSLIFWCSILIFSIFYNVKGFFSHMVPSGTPMILVIFIFLIELVSSMIRPITLMVRLVANILAGHLLMILLSLLVLKFYYIFFFYIVLNLVEIFVACIQTYIFVTMVYLYYNDVW